MGIVRKVIFGSPHMKILFAMRQSVYYLAFKPLAFIIPYYQTAASAAAVHNRKVHVKGPEAALFFYLRRGYLPFFPAIRLRFIVSFTIPYSQENTFKVSPRFLFGSSEDEDLVLMWGDLFLTLDDATDVLSVKERLDLFKRTSTDTPLGRLALDNGGNNPHVDIFGESARFNIQSMRALRYLERLGVDFSILKPGRFACLTIEGYGQRGLYESSHDYLKRMIPKVQELVRVLRREIAVHVIPSYNFMDIAFRSFEGNGILICLDFYRDLSERTEEEPLDNGGKAAINYQRIKEMLTLLYHKGYSRGFIIDSVITLWRKYKIEELSYPTVKCLLKQALKLGWVNKILVSDRTGDELYVIAQEGLKAVAHYLTLHQKINVEIAGAEADGALRDYLPTIIEPGMVVADMGAARGKRAVVCANSGAFVDAIEIHQETLQEAIAYFAQQSPEISQRITAVLSDLFSHPRVSDKKYDVIVFAPPRINEEIVGASADWMRIIIDPQFSLLSRFLDQAQKHLKRRGAVVLAYGDQDDLDPDGSVYMGGRQTLERVARNWHVECALSRPEAMFALYRLDPIHSASFDNGGNNPYSRVHIQDSHITRGLDIVDIIKKLKHLGIQAPDIIKHGGKVVDVGVGGLPFSTCEMAYLLKLANQNIDIIGTELPSNAARAHIFMDSICLEEFRPYILQVLDVIRKGHGGWRPQDIMDLRFVVNSQNQVNSILVIFGRFGVESECLTLAVAEGYTYIVGGKENPCLGHNHVFNVLYEYVSDIAESLISAGEDTAIDGVRIVFEPTAGMLESHDVSFVVTGDLAQHPRLKYADVVIASFVVMHMTSDEQNKFIGETLLRMLGENGVAIIKNKVSNAFGRDDVSSRILMYQKQLNRLILVGDAFSDQGIIKEPQRAFAKVSWPTEPPKSVYLEELLRQAYRAVRRKSSDRLRAPPSFDNGGRLDPSGVPQSKSLVLVLCYKNMERSPLAAALIRKH
ncbi:MAG: hypothetical protein PHV55_09110, partial [Candidatus Omnitrophica bacterium]|nr:hypothetical protein [Candidatus Omnitrophota bacterium]